MNPIILAFYNDAASQATMSQYASQAVLAYSNSKHLIYMWTSVTTADAEAVQALFNQSGQPGYPVGGLQLPQ